MSEEQRATEYRDPHYECPRCESYSTAFIKEEEKQTVPIYWWVCVECGMVWAQTDGHEFKQRLDNYYKFKLETEEQ